MACPIGGERFEALVTEHYSSFGSRPDGREHTYWYSPLPIPECPSNGLLLFDEFTPDQLAVLPSLIASDEYQAMIGSESTYYRAQWLATRIGMPEREALWMLLQATWQVKPADGMVGQPLPSPTLAERYQREFVTRVRALSAEPRDEEYVLLYARAANVEREFGRFDEAARMINSVRGEYDDPDLAGYLTALETAVRRRDASLEPLDMIDEYRAASLCAAREIPENTFAREFCFRPEIRELMEELADMEAAGGDPDS